MAVAGSTGAAGSPAMPPPPPRPVDARPRDTAPPPPDVPPRPTVLYVTGTGANADFAGDDTLSTACDDLGFRVNVETDTSIDRTIWRKRSRSF